MTQDDTTVSKIAEVTLAFWIMKIAATTLGETAGDLLSMTLKIGYGASTLILLSFFLVALAVQLAARRFHPLLYWLVILATSTAGTTLSDYMDRTLGLGYATGSAILVTTLLIVLAAWRVTLGSISVDTVRSRKAEGFYWAAILVSNTLGTALGDFLADSSGLGFLGGAALIASSIALIALAYRFTSLSRIGLFWAAFVLTRPLGATVGDLLTKGAEKGGLGFGTIGSSAVLAAILVGMIVLTYRRRPDARPA
jgi:uncharacterized membrane-anchored protein